MEDMHCIGEHTMGQIGNRSLRAQHKHRWISYAAARPGYAHLTVVAMLRAEQAESVPLLQSLLLVHTAG